jgi:hypothetical protein
MARHHHEASIRTISGYINVTDSLELEPPLACRRWFVQVADGAFCLYNTERASQSGEAAVFNLVLDQVHVSVQPHVQMLQLTYKVDEKKTNGISFQVKNYHRMISRIAILDASFRSLRTDSWTFGWKWWRSRSRCCPRLPTKICGLKLKTL